MVNTPIYAPAGAVPEHALAFAGPDGLARVVATDRPLPTEAMLSAASSTPLAGSVTASGTIGPFAPQTGRPIWLTLSGAWSGSVVVCRSLDGGTTLSPLTVGGQPWGSFAANANEPVGEESVAGALWYLTVTLASGTLAYRVQQ